MELGKTVSGCWEIVNGWVVRGDLGLDRVWTGAVFGGFLGEKGAFWSDFDAKVVSVGDDLGVFGAFSASGNTFLNASGAIFGCVRRDFGGYR